jgi:phosphoenolpyruvate synthase/pyruvate phosphate dikinase
VLQAEGLGAALFAFRSSAVQEDGQDAAFAGAAESFLNVTPEQVLGKVVESWASFWLERGVLYRHAQGLGAGEVEPAVTVQRMVRADVSGVIFTVDPTPGAEDALIEARPGLEGVVGGTEADAFHGRLEDGEETRLPSRATKRTRLVPDPRGGVREEPVPRGERRRASLTQDQRRRLLRIAAALKAHFGRHLDIEFAIEGGRIYILQARPITTLSARQ